MTIEDLKILLENFDDDAGKAVRPGKRGEGLIEITSVEEEKDSFYLDRDGNTNKGKVVILS